MVTVIRDIHEDNDISRPRYSGGWKFILLLLIFVCIGLAYYYGSIFGREAWFVFGLIAFLGLVLFIRQSSRKDKRIITSNKTMPIQSVLERRFARSAHAGIIIENGNVVTANDSYMELVDSLGLEVNSDLLPLPEKIFEHASTDVKAAIYRLNHLDDLDAFSEEDINIWDENGELKRYLVRLTVFKEQRFWEIIDRTFNGGQDSRLLSRAPIGLLTVHMDGDLVSANDVFCKWIGEDNIEALNIRDFVENAEGLLDSPKDVDRVVRFDTRLITRKDMATPVVLVASWFEEIPGKYLASIALHGHSSISVQASDEAVGHVISAATPGVNAQGLPFAMVDLDGAIFKEARIKSCNQAFLDLTDLEQADGLRISDIIISTAAESYNLDYMKSGSSFDGEIKGMAGTFVSVYASVDQTGQYYRLFLVDISARKVLEDQLIQSQKMQAIGRLVAEIAHDFNNLLAAIRLYTDTLLGRHPIGDPSYPELQQINANVNRAAALVKKLLAYSRKQTIRAEILDVSETLSDMAVTLKQVLGEKVRLEIKHGRDLPPIRVDKSQFDTVLMNLAVNARDAMKDQGGGIITIQSRILSKSDVSNSGLMAALRQISGQRVVAISVTDTGTGITEEIKSKIFEPFFTTKGQGEGTGLGLSTVYGIVQQSGGHLAVESKLDVGTTFTIYLPESQIDEDSDGQSSVVEPVKNKRPKAPSDLAGSGNILFVEDEDSVRVIAAKTLRKRGYTVVEAVDGEQAFEQIEAAEVPFDLMISDVVMPGMDGPTLLKKARPHLQDTRIVFISGYAEEQFSDLLAEEPDVTFLPKPFTLIQLAEKVKQQIGKVV